MKITRILAGLALVASHLLGGCGERDLDGPRQYFARGAIGSSPDYGIVKFNEPQNMVAVVYGFSGADAEMCRLMAEKLNEHACEELGGEGCLDPFSCVPVNLPY